MERRRLRVLLVEDDEDDYVIVRDLLSEVEGLKCDLEWVAAYESALEVLSRDQHDVYLVDYRLGTHDGLEFLRQATKRGCKTPVIFLTGQGGREVDVEAMRAGAADYLVKGHIDASVLERAIRYAIERAQTLEELRKSEERSRSIVQAMPIPMVISRLADSTVLYANDHFAALLGRARRVAKKQKLANLATHFGEDWAWLGELQKEEGLADRELRGQRADGTPFWVNVSTRRILFEGEEAVLVGFYDVTERKRTEQEFLRLERLRALGEISAGISHNLNNLLVGILGPAQTLEKRVDDPRVLELAGDIVTSARRAKELVRRLHQAVRGGEEERVEAVDINRAVREAVRAAQPRWKDEPESRGITIEVVVDLDESAIPVRGTWSGLHDILLNLLFNAVDAMPVGGALTIRTRAAEGEMVLVVRDTGIGMDEETRKRVFEPFFTTKANVGTGLGLYTVYGTVSRLGGRVEVESALGRGTAFTFHFPVWTETGQRREKRGRKVRRGRRGKLLIVDDDCYVCKTLSYLLADEHEVETAESGQEALQRFVPGYYDAILIDLGMAEIPGDQVAQQIKQLEPEVTTVLITGWEVQESDPRVAGFDFRIEKPFEDADEVRDLVARAVELRDLRAEGEKRTGASGQA